MAWIKQLAAVTAGVLLLMGVVVGGRLLEERSLAVHIDQTATPWYDPQLEARLVRHLTRHQNGKIFTPGHSVEGHQPAPMDLWNIDSLVSFGESIGSQFVLAVKIDRAGLERRKVFHLPLIFHQYQTYGVIAGEMRLVDVSRQKLLLAEAVMMEEKGPRIFQATMDDDVNDPDLNLTAPAKSRFFAALEDKLAEQLAQRVAAVIRLR
jgi:hypothetical protein